MNGTTAMTTTSTSTMSTKHTATIIHVKLDVKRSIYLFKTEMLKLLQKTQTLLRKLTTSKEQERYFDQQKLAIQQLTRDERFAFVREYREQEASTAITLLTDPTTKDVAYYQAKVKVSTDFLNRLDTLGE